MPPTTLSPDPRVPARIIGYVSATDAPGDARQRLGALRAAGFEVMAESRRGTAVAGSPGAWAAITGSMPVARDETVRGRAGRPRQRVTVLDFEGDRQPAGLGAGMAMLGEVHTPVALERARTPLATAFPAAVGPDLDRDGFYLRVPRDVAHHLRATDAHDRGWRGAGARVAMVDTGHFRHPYFRPYDVDPAVPVAPGSSPGRDPLGHGTGESANVLAVAPRARLVPYRASDEAGKLVAGLAGFMRAKGAEPRPDVITCSWGAEGDEPATAPTEAEAFLVEEIREALEAGIVVVWSAGNGGISIEAQVPGVISAGGVYIGEDGTIRASDYASAYESRWQALSVPTVCGLVGLRPRASYILLPVPPGCPIDRERAAPELGEPGDGTLAHDGWALFSGTSAAAPQIAGAAALLVGAAQEHLGRRLTPEQVREALCETARDVESGETSPKARAVAGSGHDIATGCGLVDAHAAVSYALESF